MFRSIFMSTSAEENLCGLELSLLEKHESYCIELVDRIVATA